MSELQIGEKAPDFSVSIADNKNLELSDLSGKYVVLYFYPKDNTPGCTVEAKDFNELLPEFLSHGAEVIGISKDSLKSHDKFRELYDLKFYLGSDVECNICSDYGVWVQKSMFGKKYMGINRASFLIDKEGKIACIWPKVKVSGHAQEVLDKIKEINS